MYHNNLDKALRMAKPLIFLLLCFQYSIAEDDKLNLVPDIKLKMLDGKKVQLYDFLEEGPLLIDFWATWCAPCKKEMKHLNKFHKAYTDSGFNVLMINEDSPRSLSKVKSYVKSKKFVFHVALDPNQQISKKMNAVLFPTTILIDRKGNILWKHQGYMIGDEVEIEEQILLALRSDSLSVSQQIQDSLSVTPPN